MCSRCSGHPSQGDSSCTRSSDISRFSQRLWMTEVTPSKTRRRTTRLSPVSVTELRSSKWLWSEPLSLEVVCCTAELGNMQEPICDYINQPWNDAPNDVFFNNESVTRKACKTFIMIFKNLWLDTFHSSLLRALGSVSYFSTALLTSSPLSCVNASRVMVFWNL